MIKSCILIPSRINTEEKILCCEIERRNTNAFSAVAKSLNSFGVLVKYCLGKVELQFLNKIGQNIAAKVKSLDFKNEGVF